MPNLINFRDFGGHETRFGKPVRAGCLYRCGHLSKLDDDVLKRLLAFDFAVIADLRYPDERTAARSPWPESWLERVLSSHGAHDANAPHLTLFEAAMASQEAVDKSYRDFYAALPFDRRYRPLFSQIIQRIADQGGRVLIHCSAGKDRTGILSALVLHSLGVSRDAIVADYRRSSRSPELLAMKTGIMAQARKEYGCELSDASAESMLGAEPQYLAATFSAIEAKCGSVEAYLDAGGAEEGIRARLRERFLEP